MCESGWDTPDMGRAQCKENLTCKWEAQSMTFFRRLTWSLNFILPVIGVIEKFKQASDNICILVNQFWQQYGKEIGEGMIGIWGPFIWYIVLSAEGTARNTMQIMVPKEMRAWGKVVAVTDSQSEFLSTTLMSRLTLQLPLQIQKLYLAKSVLCRITYRWDYAPSLHKILF